MNEDALDKALSGRPRGNPGRSVLRATKVASFPADYVPEITKDETARKALGAVQRVWTTTKKLHDDGAALPELGKNAVPAIQRAFNAVDKAREELGKVRERKEKEIAAHISAGADDRVAAEVRAHVKALGAKAQGFVSERIRAGDHTIAAAVLGAPPYLSGLDEKAQTALRTAAEIQFAAESTAIRDQIDRDVALLERAGSRLFQEVFMKADEWSKTTDAMAELAEGEAQ